MKTELYAVLVKLTGETLLLPNAAVIEVISAEQLQRPNGNAPGWLAGSVQYNERKLPAVHFEALNGGTVASDARRARLAILQGMGADSAGAHYALVCQGYPHLVTLNREALRKEPHLASDRGDLVLSRVRIANTSALIPNLEMVEAELAELKSARQIA